jgi:hypothetical protein
VSEISLIGAGLTEIDEPAVRLVGEGNILHWALRMFLEEPGRYWMLLRSRDNKRLSLGLVDLQEIILHPMCVPIEPTHDNSCYRRGLLSPAWGREAVLAALQMWTETPDRLLVEFRFVTGRWALMYPSLKPDYPAMGEVAPRGSVPRTAHELAAIYPWRWAFRVGSASDVMQLLSAHMPD